MEDLDQLIADSLARVEELLAQTICSDQTEARVNTMCLQLILSGGKRIRPKIALLCGHLIPGLLLSDADGETLCKCAAAVELLHTATLVHDDVIDRATTRRGKPTLNETDGNHAAVLAGDYMLARNFLLMQELESFAVFKAAGETTSKLVEGELQQLAREGDLQLTEADYRQTIFCKTGALFSLAASIYTLAKAADPRYVEALKTYGIELGIAFQVTDDMLDYTSSASQLGKPVGEDLQDLRITLPLIYALHTISEQDRLRLTSAVRANDLQTVRDFIAKSRALDYCRDYATAAASRARQALEIFDPSPYRQALSDLCLRVIERHS